MHSLMRVKDVYIFWKDRISNQTLRRKITKNRVKYLQHESNNSIYLLNLLKIRYWAIIIRIY